jgi:hypothetical protein
VSLFTHREAINMRVRAFLAAHRPEVEDFGEKSARPS